MKHRVLVFCGDCWHPAKIVRDGLQPLAETGFEFTFCEFGSGSLADLVDFPLVILAKANMVSETDQRIWLDKTNAQPLANHVRDGGGLIVIHAGSARYEKIPAMNALIGGAFVSHPDQCAVTIEPVTGHRLTAGVATFTVCDEHYFMSLNDLAADVFLHARSEHGLQPAGWTRTSGQGRVCVLTPGHNQEVWRHPEFQKLLSNALRWAAERTGK